MFKIINKFVEKAFNHKKIDYKIENYKVNRYISFILLTKKTEKKIKKTFSFYINTRHNIFIV